MKDTSSRREIALNGKTMSDSTIKIALRILGFLLAIPSSGLFLWGLSLYLSNAVRFEELPAVTVACGTSALGGVIFMLVSSPVIMGSMALLYLSSKRQVAQG